MHFVFDILHFDGKFFHTLGNLFRKPGFVAKEYTAGRRASHLDPIRMYLFTSAVFFLIFYSVADLRNAIGGKMDEWELNGRERLEHTGQVYARLRSDSGNAALQKELSLLTDTGYSIRLFKTSWNDDYDSGIRTRFRDKEFYLVAKKRQPDSAARADNESWLEKKLSKQFDKAQAENGGSVNATIEGLLDNFLHKSPYLLFLSLPFFALILKLAYVRHKSLYYSDHAVFTLYHYIVSFLLILLVFFFKWLANLTALSLFEILSGLSFLGGGIYLFLSMKRFYGQSWGKTTLKFLLVNLLGFVVLLFLLVVFLAFSVSQL